MTLGVVTVTSSITLWHAWRTRRYRADVGSHAALGLEGGCRCPVLSPA
jgi:hypothetical protein